MGIPAVIESALEQLPAARVHSFDTLYEADADARAARGRARRRCAPMSWLLAFLGFAAADHPARARPLHGRQGGRDAGGALLALLPAAARARPARRDGVRDRVDPARRLREDHRHEPGGGDPAGGRPPRLLPPAGVEADRRDRRRAGREHRARVRAPAHGVPADLGHAGQHADQRASRRSRPKARRRRCCRPATGSSPSTASAATREALRDQVATHTCAGARSTAARPRRRPRSRSCATASEQTVSITPLYDARRSAAAARLQLRHRAHVRAVGSSARRLDERDQLWSFTTRDRRDDRRHLPGRQAQGDLRRRRLLRDDAPGDLALGRPGGVPARGHLALARRSSTCSRSCRSTAATSSGRSRRRCAAARSRSASWSARGSSASRSSSACS